MLVEWYFGTVHTKHTGVPTPLGLARRRAVGLQLKVVLVQECIPVKITVKNIAKFLAVEVNKEEPEEYIRVRSNNVYEVVVFC